MEGKVVVVMYAIAGIPLMLMLLAGIGEKLVLVVNHINRINVCKDKRSKVRRRPTKERKEKMLSENCIIMQLY